MPLKYPYVGNLKKHSYVIYLKIYHGGIIYKDRVA